MPNPQLEEGFFRLANSLADAFCRLKASGAEWQVFFTIIRETYGWGVKQRSIALEVFVLKTGLPKPSIFRAIKSLKERNIIFAIKIDSEKSKTYGIIKDFSKWKTLSKLIISKNAIKIDKKTLSKLIAPYIGTKDNKKRQKEKEIKKKKVREKAFEHFELLWGKYPNKAGKKRAETSYRNTVKSKKAEKEIEEALDAYLNHLAQPENGFKRPQNGSTWFNNWTDWVGWVEPEKGEEDIYSQPPREY